MNVAFPSLSRRAHERGLVVVYVAILALVIIGLVGLALDGAFISRTSQQLQHAADAAALNAVRFVKIEADPFPKARDAAINVALANEAAKLTVKLDANPANDAAGDIVVGQWDLIANTFTPTITTPNAVRVRAKRNSANADGPLSLFIGPVFGKDASDVGVTATAVLAPPPVPLVLILDPVKSGALLINGTNSLQVNGKIHANSNNACGIKLVGTPTMAAMITSVVGGACYPSGTITGPVKENADVIPDPLANVLPTVADWNNLKSSMTVQPGTTGTGAITDSGTYNPGYYPGGLSAASTSVITLNPGSYMFGTEVTLAGSAYVNGTGVTLFLDKDVDLDISGSGAGMSLTPPSSGNPFFGITMFTHRQTSPSTKFKIGGGGAFLLEGVVYVPQGELVMGGVPGKEIGAIIAWTASTNGTTGFFITGKGVPPLSNEPEVAYLVE